MYGGNAKSTFVTSVSDLVYRLNQEGIGVTQIYLSNESLITRARNTLVHKFLKLENHDALLFIDSDHGFNADDVVKMIKSGKDLIGAIYPMKSIHWDNVRKAALAGKPNLELYSGIFAVNLSEEVQEVRFDAPFKVKNIATGMMFIRKNVFEELKPICKIYKNNSPTADIEFGEEIVEYFTTFIDENSILLSEDYAFSAMWRSLGNTVWAAPWVRITHHGDYAFSGNFMHTIQIEQENQPSTNSQESDDSSQR